MIEQIYVVNFGCLRVVKARLTPLHAFIGPNDTGKSSMLRALELVVLAAGRSPSRPLVGVGYNRLAAQVEDRLVQAGVPGGASYSVGRNGKRLFEGVTAPSGGGKQEPMADLMTSQLLGELGAAGPYRVLVENLRGVRLLRLDPDALRLASTLLPEGSSIGFADERGSGLPGVYDAIMNRGDDSFRSVADDVRTLFPTVKNLRLKTISPSTKVIEVELTDGKKVTADEMSEGLLYYLGFAAIGYLEPTSLLLVEEPENGLHPSRIADIIHALRAISERGTQVVMATHSPLVINELRPEEVTVFTRDAEKGTIVTPILETPRFAERSQVYGLGELWLAYANGKDEGPLLGGEGTSA
ncbi:MAG: ATP-binding protein [Deltaproteobacteria bacterium]|nr:ATP-binding protein [Deltaproteobacteria bacterium]